MPQVKNHIVIIVGVESSGKTTLGKQLGRKTRYVFHDEIGGMCRRKAGCDVTTKCSLFDNFVMLKEFERDQLLREHSEFDFSIFEQWHLGNVAFAETRNSDVASCYLNKLKDYWDQGNFHATVFKLMISLEEILRRKSAAGIPNCELEGLKQFYSQWDEALERVIQALNVRPIFIDGEKFPDAVFDDVLRHLKLEGKRCC